LIVTDTSVWIPLLNESASLLVAERRRGRRAALSLVATGQIKLRRIDGWRKIATVLSQNTPVAA
jgi:hypothetical protein